jgi:tagatose-6-phosphate ketose/aldose isomerase
MVSFARSGDSPESVGALEMLLENEPQIRHLLLTCNANGRLAITFKNHERVTVVVLDEQTNDTSLVMTSSFTNMVLAALSLCKLSDPDSYRATAESLSVLAEDLLYNRMDSIAALSRKDFKRAVFLASGPRLGAAREAALKMTEMTAGRIIAMSESYLGLRHGPMSGVHSDTLVICFLSSDPLVRAYEYDLITELNEKHLGMAKLLFGDQVPAGLALPQDLVIDCKGLAALGDDNVPILDVVVSQLLAFFKCLQEGLQPDSPSTNGIINRVVQEFKLHRPEE